MHLWTEYEGNTLAGYTIGRLSRSEGRSAFFTTTADGHPALLRLTESHFDEGELIGRWKQAAVVKDPGLQEIRNFGQATLDGVALAFCLLEPNDASLSDVLRERVLTAEEAGEVAEAVAGGLAALHAAGLMHGHVDAINVFAMGEVVKLRSDCVRECTGDFEADTPEAREALRQRDVHDLGLLLRRCLTPQWEESTATQLPAPFDRIVRRALNGSASAAAIAAEMEALKPAAPVEVRRTATTAVAPSVPVVRAASADSVQAAAPAGTRRADVADRGVFERARSATTSPAAVSAPAQGMGGGSARRRKGVGALSTVSVGGENSPGAVSAMLADRDRAQGRLDLGVADRRTGADRGDAGDSGEPLLRSLKLARLDRVRNRLRHDAGMETRGGLVQAVEALKGAVVQHKIWVASGLVAAVLALGLWNAAGSHPASAASDRTAIAPPAVAAPPVRVAAQAGPDISKADTAQARVAAGQGAGESAARSARGGNASSARTDWHVIAYTYNVEKQAAAKAGQLRQKYLALQPQVYSPTGRAPYFVALGGPSDAVSAIALRNRARREGLPRDTYARNF